MIENPFLPMSDDQLEKLANTYNTAKFSGTTPLHLFKDNDTYDLIMRALLAKYLLVHGLQTLDIWNESLRVDSNNPSWDRVIEELVTDCEELVHMSEYNVALRVRAAFLPYQITDAKIEELLKVINEAI